MKKQMLGFMRLVNSKAGGELLADEQAASQLSVAPISAQEILRKLNGAKARSNDAYLGLRRAREAGNDIPTWEPRHEQAQKETGEYEAALQDIRNTVHAAVSPAFQSEVPELLKNMGIAESAG